jgi:hypothetical protein
MSLPFHERSQIYQHKELETLLHSYFRAEMPKSWPALNPAVESADSPARRPRSRRAAAGRYALAASLLLLLAGQLSLLALLNGSTPVRPDREPGRIEAAKPSIERKSPRPASSQPRPSQSRENRRQ